MLSKRSEEIKQKDLLIETLEKRISEAANQPKPESEDSYKYPSQEDMQMQGNIENFFLDSKTNHIEFAELIRRVQNAESIYSEHAIDSKVLATLGAYDAIETKGRGVYTWTPTGKRFLRYYIENPERMGETG